MLIFKTQNYFLLKIALINKGFILEYKMNLSSTLPGTWTKRCCLPGSWWARASCRVFDHHLCQMQLWKKTRKLFFITREIQEK